MGFSEFRAFQSRWVRGLFVSLGGHDSTWLIRAVGCRTSRVWWRLRCHRLSPDARWWSSSLCLLTRLALASPDPVPPSCTFGNIEKKQQWKLFFFFFSPCSGVPICLLLKYQKKRRSNKEITHLCKSSGSQLAKKLVTASATSSLLRTSQSPSVPITRTSSAPCSYCIRLYTFTCVSKGRR